MTRTTARRLAIQLSFAANAGSDIGPEDFFEEDYFRALPEEDALFSELPDDRQKEYIRTLVNGVRELFYADILTGIYRVIEACLGAGAIAVGFAAALMIGGGAG